MLVVEAVAVAAADGVTFDAEAVISSIMQSARALATGRASMCRISGQDGALRLISSTAPLCGWAGSTASPPRATS